VVAVSVALFCIQVDFFALNLALPDMARSFGVGLRDVQWTLSAYMLSLGSLFILGGRMGDIFGRRRALLGGIATFGVASAACALQLARLSAAPYPHSCALRESRWASEGYPAQA
jgi:MFS family permease